MSEEIDAEFEKYWNSLATVPSESAELVMHCKYAAKCAWLAAAPSISISQQELLATTSVVMEPVGVVRLITEAGGGDKFITVEWFVAPDCDVSIYSAEQLATIMSERDSLLAKLEQSYKDKAELLDLVRYLDEVVAIPYSSGKLRVNKLLSKYEVKNG